MPFFNKLFTKVLCKTDNFGRRYCVIFITKSRGFRGRLPGGVPGTCPPCADSRDAPPPRRRPAAQEADALTL